MCRALPMHMNDLNMIPTIHSFPEQSDSLSAESGVSLSTANVNSNQFLLTRSLFQIPSETKVRVGKIVSYQGEQPVLLVSMTVALKSPAV